MTAKGKTTKEHDEKIASMLFSDAYPLYVNKVVKKGRTEEELRAVITWLTGFEGTVLDGLITGNATLRDFFDQATLNPNADKIKGVICGYRIEEIETPLTRQCRYLDKIVDELAKGKSLEKICRS